MQFQSFRGGQPARVTLVINPVNSVSRPPLLSARPTVTFLASSPPLTGALQCYSELQRHVCVINDFAIQSLHDSARKLCYRKDDRAMSPNLEEEEAIGGRGWYHSKECW